MKPKAFLIFLLAALACPAYAKEDQIESSTNRTLGWYSAKNSTYKASYASRVMTVIHADDPKTSVISDYQLKECLDEAARGPEAPGMSLTMASALCVQLMEDR